MPLSVFAFGVCTWFVLESVMVSILLRAYSYERGWLCRMWFCLVKEIKVVC